MHPARLISWLFVTVGLDNPVGTIYPLLLAYSNEGSNSEERIIQIVKRVSKLSKTQHTQAVSGTSVKQMR